MIYTNVKFTACILMAVLVSTSLAQPSMSLKDKLARLLMDPENNEFNNEIFDQDDEDWQQRQRFRGMLLHNSELPARMMKNNLALKNMFKKITAAQSDEYFEKEPATTTKAPTTQLPNIVMVGMEPIRSMFSRFMEIIRNYNSQN